MPLWAGSFGALQCGEAKGPGQETLKLVWAVVGLLHGQAGASPDPHPFHGGVVMIPPHPNPR